MKKNNKKTNNDEILISNSELQHITCVMLGEISDCTMRGDIKGAEKAKELLWNLLSSVRDA